MEGGATPGDARPVFNCDFGKLGIQICYDMEFDDGWAELARRGAELVAVGFRYYEDEDRGIFWSNDPGITVGEMVRSIGVLEIEEEMARVRQFYRKAGVRPPNWLRKRGRVACAIRCSAATGFITGKSPTVRGRARYRAMFICETSAPRKQPASCSRTAISTPNHCWSASKTPCRISPSNWRPMTPRVSSRRTPWCS